MDLDARVAAPARTELVADPARFVNRELSWLDFNERVLASADRDDTPWLERAKFLAIFSSNLDEFFQVRVAGLMDQVFAGISATTPDGRTPTQQLTEVRARVTELLARQEELFTKVVVPGLAEHGIVFSDYADADEDDYVYLDQVFEDRVFPVLTPLAVDPGHPFPYISDLSLNLAVIVVDPTDGTRRFARVKVPPVLSRFVVMPDGERFIPLEQVIAFHLDRLFPGMEIEGHFPFRVTRNADLTLEEEEADDLLAAVELELRRRRFGRAVRLEIDDTMTDEIRDLLVRELDIDDDAVYTLAGPLDLSGLWSVHALDKPDLADPVWVPVTRSRLATAEDDQSIDFFRELRQGDLLVHHPYDSFTTSVEAFIRQASIDPKVLAIKLTLYRTTRDSSIIESLIRAAERGKQVVALVELKARFDEQRNIEWARELENAGVHVVYGLVGLKTHTKTTLVVRDETDGVRRYCHIGTGNYNPRTARLYEDLGLLTADRSIGEDLTQLFNFLTGYARDTVYDKLLVAPRDIRPGLVELVRNEMRHGTEGRIVLKMNSLVDPDLIDVLYEASAAGVQIDCIVRGICCLRAEVPGLSEHIRVRSIIGRFLEHARVYHFAHGADGGPVYLMGSADLMPRNLDRRVEALVPIEAPELRDEVAEVLRVNLDDDVLAWRLLNDEWAQIPTVEGIDTHVRLQELALQRRRSAG